ncbi:MAG: enoyl-CoA hydratase/isomerase family protein [Alphaproteobacteria bacterium]|nr:enoyl-CoA hydratase/isomerase family protein [Alphaproteobacteria bacterium]MDX5368586.1 enoyl-CoA hydratase/isomerase family protein [Alphaproteobacteria bacterium]MDX5463331.1 enoyl-CoA hydratase/isomerase family protein [Alphaproteobacteria bacterium]
MNRSAAIEVDAGGPVARITLAAPDRRNALTRTDIAALSAALTGIAKDGQTRAVVLTGTGTVFSAGVSLGDVAGSDWTENPLTALCDTIEQIPQPVVAALNGGVYGGAVEIALACDFRIGVPEMALRVPPAALGIHYAPEGLGRVASRLGLQTAKRLFLRAETLKGAAALCGVGFLDAVADPADTLLDRADEMAREIAALAPLAVAGMKRTLNEIGAGTLDRAAADERVATCWASADLREGLAAQAEKRKPVFQGR